MGARDGGRRTAARESTRYPIFRNPSFGLTMPSVQVQGGASYGYAAPGTTAAYPGYAAYPDHTAAYSVGATAYTGRSEPSRDVIFRGLDAYMTEEHVSGITTSLSTSLCPRISQRSEQWHPLLLCASALVPLLLLNAACR